MLFNFFVTTPHEKVSSIFFLALIPRYSGLSFSRLSTAEKNESMSCGFSINIPFVPLSYDYELRGCVSKRLESDQSDW